MRNPVIRQNHLTLMLIWFVLLLSQGMFLVVVYFNRPESFHFDGTQPILGQQPLFPIMFGFLAVVDIAIAFVIRARGINYALGERNPKYLQTSLVISCALCEAVSLLGMFLAFAFAYQYFFVWFIVGFMGIAVQFPRREHVRLATLKG